MTIIETAVERSVQFAIQENISGEWFTRPTRFENADDAGQSRDDVFGVDDPATRVVAITTLIAPVSDDTSHDLCKCGHMRAEHADVGMSSCLVTGTVDESPYRDLGMNFSDECMKFERAL